MGSKYSDSHVENLERFYTIIQICTAMGAVYNPSNPKLSIANMTLKHNEAENLHDVYNEAYVKAKLPINKKQDLIAELVKRMRRVKNAVFSSEASKELMKDVKGMVDKFTGDKVRKKKPKEGKPAKKRVSNSHLSVEERLDTFLGLIELLRLEPHYAPNEPDLKIVALEDAATKLDNINTAVIEANVEASIKKIARDEAFYLEDEGLVDVSLQCKKYVRALFGARSEEAKSVSKVKLKRFMKLRK
jgi:hypothetical protein